LKNKELVLIAEGNAVYSPPRKIATPYGEYSIDDVSMSLVTTILSACILKKLVEKLEATGSEIIVEAKGYSHYTNVLEEKPLLEKLVVTIKTNANARREKIIETARNCPFINLLSNIVEVEINVEKY